MQTNKSFALRSHLAIFAILLFVFSMLLGGILDSGILKEKSDGIYASGNMWADMPWHMSMASSIKERGLGATIESNPIFSGGNLSYPVMPAYLNALLMKSGLSIRQAFMLSSFIPIVALFCALFFVSAYITKTRIGSLFIPILFFFGGSLWTLAYAYPDFLESGRTAMNFLSDLPKDYAHLKEAGVHFGNMLSDYLLPQRAFVFGLLFGALALLFLWRYWEGGERKNLLYASLIISCLPLIHSSSFLSLVIIASFLCLGNASSPLLRRQWNEAGKICFLWLSAFYIPLLILTLPQIYLVYPFDKDMMIRLSFGWMMGKENFFVFWIKNLYPFLFVLIFAYAKSPSMLKTFFNSFLGLFFVANIVQFQPWIFDNGKFIVWVYLGGLLLVAYLFEFLAKKYGWKGILISIVLTIYMTATGVLSISYRYTSSSRLFTPEDIELAKFVKENTERNAVFITSRRHNNPVATLAGRTLFLGYEGWLYSHGIAHKERMEQVREVFSGGGKSAAIIRDSNIRYLIVDPQVIREYGPDIKALEALYVPIWKGETTTLYIVPKPIAKKGA